MILKLQPRNMSAVRANLVQGSGLPRLLACTAHLCPEIDVNETVQIFGAKKLGLSWWCIWVWSTLD